MPEGRRRQFFIGGKFKPGNGPEWGEYGLNEYLEIKGIVGYG